ncbi:hypothetical protein BJV74DRAFT_797032 [Russula compacta]|nr:hypothetical protein BJV74DRAFT_797032 [Russula compacta]
MYRRQKVLCVKCGDYSFTPPHRSGHLRVILSKYSGGLVLMEHGLEESVSEQASTENTEAAPSVPSLHSFGGVFTHPGSQMACSLTQVLVVSRKRSRPRHHVGWSKTFLSESRVPWVNRSWWQCWCCAALADNLLLSYREEVVSESQPDHVGVAIWRASQQTVVDLGVVYRLMASSKRCLMHLKPMWARSCLESQKEREVSGRTGPVWGVVERKLLNRVKYRAAVAVPIDRSSCLPLLASMRGPSGAALVARVWSVVLALEWVGVGAWKPGASFHWSSSQSVEAESCIVSQHVETEINRNDVKHLVEQFSWSGVEGT